MVVAGVVGVGAVVVVFGVSVDDVVVGVVVSLLRLLSMVLVL